ncbi:RagB/SusD family nutrient uptake outer membrane protein [Riemerella columbina]|uniref:RagB/SusD family nutrient uptake outer membrane protein n=1 Tax=Riemerella columbina TaxID=103810 RepID=UPI00036D9AD3|nr:RagB/SusD family nutrient uptake outer membrane protein [Riemerella columbina]
MKFNQLKHTLFATLLLVASSCERYLDEPQPTDEVSAELVFSNAENAEANLTGITSLLRFDTNVNGQDAANLGSVYFARTVKGEDFLVPNSWYSFDYRNITRLSTHRRTNFTWRYFYKIIRQSNELITGVNSSKNISEARKKSLIARAKVLRALSYFELVQDFQLGYPYSKNMPALPLYEEYTKEAKPFSTTEEVFQFIVNDLESALPDLPVSRPSKAFVNQQVGYALAARVYQVKQDWNKAYQYAQLAYGGNVENSLDAASYSNGFKTLDSKEWILGYGQQAGQSVYWMMAPHSFTDLSVENDGYSNVYVSKTLYDLFSDTDIRKLFDYNPNADGDKKYSTYKFTFNRGEAACPYFRTAEMVLIAAEAQYRLGNTAKAQETLYKLQKNRDPKAVEQHNTGDALLEEILIERRKELYGEVGVELYDARRLSRPLKRSAAHSVVLDFKPNDPKSIYQYPQQEIDANPNVDESINNGR